MRVLVLGGDGFCGWPTSLYLSDQGHDITIVDNLSRRKIDIELEVDSLTPIRPIGERLSAWKEVSGREIGFVNLDLATEYDRLVAVLLDIRPDAIVHFAEQRAAPYSMRTEKTKRYTVDNNVRGTHNLLTALVTTGIDASLVHLGTMGVYGYGWSGSAPIPEGYLTVKVTTPDGELEREILHPANPGSVYHLTKTLDQLLFSFYAKNDAAADHRPAPGHRVGHPDRPDREGRAADQPVRLRRRLRHRAEPVPDAVRHRPPAHRARHRRPDPGVHPHPRHRPVHRDRAQQPAAGRLASRWCCNQVTETYRVLDLAKMISDMTGTEIAYLPNPRREADENELSVRNDQFLALGLKPTTLSEGLLEEITQIAAKYKHRVDPHKIIARSVWRAGMETSADLMDEVPDGG